MNTVRDKMKIGINATFLNEKPTGVGIFTRETATRLTSLHRDTVIFTSVRLESIRRNQVHKTPSMLKGSLRLPNNLFRFMYCNTVLPFTVKRSRIDILFCPMMEFPLYGSSPLIVTVHDLHPVYFPGQFGLAARHFTHSLGLLPGRAKRLIVPSNFVKKEVLKTISINTAIIDVIPLGYDTKLFRPRIDEQKHEFLKNYGIREPYILFVGSLFPYKNFRTLLKAFREIENRIPHSLVIIGIRELAKETLQTAARVHFLDYVANSDIPRFYSYADLYVNPSLVEGFGITILEVMACGAPVISSHGGSLPEVVGSAGVLFNPEDSRELGEKMLMVIRNENLRKELREKGFQQVKKFSWDRTAEQILHSCKEVYKTI
jgi:glycosyltransferase involved in cell wall biosynthesis